MKWYFLHFYGCLTPSVMGSHLKCKRFFCCPAAFPPYFCFEKLGVSRVAETPMTFTQVMILNHSHRIHLCRQIYPRQNCWWPLWLRVALFPSEFWLLRSVPVLVLPGLPCPQRTPQYGPGFQQRGVGSQRGPAEPRRILLSDAEPSSSSPPPLPTAGRRRQQSSGSVCAELGVVVWVEGLSGVLHDFIWFSHDTH